jgi:autotransporter-associated beta strand protein
METRSYALLFAALAVGTTRGQDLRSATADNLNTTGAWIDGTVPTTADIATWNAASTLANTIGAGQTWGGLDLSGAAGPVSITGAFNLGLDHSTDASTILNVGGNDFSWGGVGTGGQLNILGALSTVAPGNGNTGTGATFAGSGVVTLSSNGTKNWSTSGSATNGANGVTNVTFTGTLRLRGVALGGTGVNQIENLANNWLAFGGGGGTPGVPGALTQTGAFHLDTGDASSRGDFILTNTLNDKTLELASLSGTGNLRSDWGVGSNPLSIRKVRINQSIDTLVSGGIYTHNGSAQRRDVTFIKDGIGTLTFIGRLGSTQGAAGNPGGLNFEINGGVWQMGDGTKNPSAPLNAANWDSASTFTIGSAGTLRFMANESEYVWNRPIEGSGALEITNDGTAGEGLVALTADSPNFTGTTSVLAGRLRVSGDLGASPVSVASGAGITAGTLTTPGGGFVKSLSLAAGSTSNFRAGAIFDQIIVNDADSLTAAGPHVITAVSTGGLNPGDKVTIIDYEGSFSDFANLSLAPGSRFALVHNTGDTNIELEYTGGTLVWAGGNGDWDLDTTPNWTLGGSPTNFLAGDAALFDDSATTGNVVLVGTQSPSSITIDNDSLAYTLGGGSIDGIGSFTKQGPGIATVTSPTSYIGTTFIDGGTLTFGDGATSGEIGSGPVDLLAGATLRIHRSDFLDYKTNPRLRNVAGTGDIIIDGGGTVFNYTGTGVGFADANSWAGFSGTLTVRGGSEFQTIRNGATAMGTGSIVLGDATTSGSLSQIEGNWTWTNPITLTGADNRIINRSLNGPRLLKLQGVISGSGGLTFDDAAATMTNTQTGFILTGENTLDGTLTIPAGVPVRVGGVPGNADAIQNGAGAAGSLGSATVLNDGFLTFSRTDSHTVANAISGAGQTFIGLTTGTAGQVVTFTGTKSYTGPTTVRSGTLLLETALPDSPVVVESAGTLGGTGTLGIASSVSGTLAPGTAVGTLTSTSDIALENGSKIAWQISDWNGSAGTGYDTIQATSLTIGAIAATPITVVVTGESLVNFSETPKTFTLASTSGGISGLDAGEIIVDDSNAPGGGTWSVQANGDNLELVYTLGNAYDAYESANGISGAGADTDSDNDGIPNGIEFVIGGDPSGPDSDSNALLPTATVDATSLTFVFRRTDDSAGFNPFVEYGSTLGGWTPAEAGVDGVTISEENDFYPGNIDRVTVVIPRSLATGEKLFARLRINIP